MTELTTTTSLQAFLPTGGVDPTMSSIEIAELTRKRHDNVMRDARKMLLDLHGEHGLLRFEGTYLDAQSKEQPCVNLPKRECLTLISGYSVKLRARIIDRWMELEQVAKPVALDFSDPRLLLGVVTHLQTQVVEKEAVIAEQGVRLKKLDRIEGAGGSMCFTDAAKTLKKGPQEMIRFMSARQWIYKRVGNNSWVGRQAKIEAGYLEHREHVYLDKDGFERVATRALVTGKGLVKLAELLEQPLH